MMRKRFPVATRVARARMLSAGRLALAPAAAVCHAFPSMKQLLPLLALSLSATFAVAEIPASNYPRAVFSDDFSSDGFGKAWSHYKSGSVVKDGVLKGITPEGSDHNAVDVVKIEPERDVEVSVKFRLVSDKAKGFNVWLDDRNYKGSHAGHICSVAVGLTGIVISDAKTGRFRNDIYEKSKATPPVPLTAEEQAYLKTKTVTTPATVSLKDWHTLVVRTKADEVEVLLDGKPAGSFKSEGIAHDSKTIISLTTNKEDVEYDDFSIKAAAK